MFATAADVVASVVLLIDGVVVAHLCRELTLVPDVMENSD